MASHLGDVKRFKSAREVAGYAGLVPKQIESGQMSAREMLSLTAAHPEMSAVRLIGSTRSQMTARYSPDAHIVFQSNRSGSTEIWMTDSQGADPDQLPCRRAILIVPEHDGRDGVLHLKEPLLRTLPFAAGALNGLVGDVADLATGRQQGRQRAELLVESLSWPQQVRGTLSDEMHVDGSREPHHRERGRDRRY